jgi:predicted transcriptional regulator
VKGVSALDILNLPDEIGQLIRILSNEKTMALAEIAQHFDLPESKTEEIMKVLVERGYMQVVNPETPQDQLRYRVYYARMRKRNIPLDL